MKFGANINGQPCDIKLSFRSVKNNCSIRTLVYGKDEQDVIIERHDVDVTPEGKTIILKLPITPEFLIIDCSSVNGSDLDFVVDSYDILPLKKYNVPMGSGDKEFIEFASDIVKNLKNTTPTDSVIFSKSGRFKMVLFDKIIGYDGKVRETPCQIGQKTGTIELSKSHLMKMSQSQRMATLCHEFGHFYKNPLIGLDVRDEIGADLNGMAVYLGSGFSNSEYINGFRKVFKGAQTQQNEERYRVMNMFALKIFNGEFFGKPYNL